MQPPEKRQIPIPQFSIRLILMVMVACALVFAIFGQALAGKHWAVGVSIALVSLAGVLLIHALLFGLVWIFARGESPSRRRPAGAGRSPFRQETPGAILPAHPGPAGDKETPEAPILLD